MTHAELAKAMAAVVKDYVRADRGALETRLAVLEAKHAAPAIPDPAIAMLMAKVAVLEDRKPLQGPPGEPGPPGKDGVDGKPGMEFKGDYREGQAYGPGDVVAWAKSAWVCFKATTTRPDQLAAMVKTDDGRVEFNGPNGKDFWRLLVKHGERGRDGRDK